MQLSGRQEGWRPESHARKSRKSRHVGGMRAEKRPRALPVAHAVVREGAEQRVGGLARGDDFGRGRRVAVYDEAGVEHMLPLGERALIRLGPVDVRLHDRRAQRIIVIGDAGGGGLAGHDLSSVFMRAAMGGRRGGQTIYAMRGGVGQGGFVVGGAL